MRQPNTLVLPDDVEQYVLLVGGEHPPLVTEIVMEATLRCQELANNKGFFTYKCSSKQDTPFTLAITGIGPSATEIAVVEYVSCGTRLVLRAGTSGALSHSIELGSVVITDKALRYDGVSNLYIGKRFKAIANRKVVEALISSAKELKVRYAVGTTLTTAGFYAMGETSTGGKIPSFRNKIGDGFEPIALAELRQLQATKKVLNVEMEAATLLTLARIYKVKSGAVCGISNRVPWREDEQIKFTHKALRNAIHVAVGALDYLHVRQMA